jgi:DNA-binding NtrC family response regulator
MEITIEETSLPADGGTPAVPGLVFIFSGSEPCFRVVRLPGRSGVVGREVDGWRLPDERLSREHATVTFDGERWSVRDLGSRNGSFVDGERRSEEYVGKPRIVRLGHTLLLPCADVQAYASDPLTVQGETVVGPKLARAHQDIDAAATGGESLLINGETGSGKELAARRFHASGPNHKGPFVAVNCATIPHGLAERLLFGARKGAYSGATADAQGQLQSADQGVLFLDEIAELEPAVQAKLLRVLEAREVQPLGANRPVPVNLQVCAATHRDLRAAAARGDFRPDLYYRLCQHVVCLPRMAERIEEIPWLLKAELQRNKTALSLHARFVEACVLRAWPGNIRELRAELRKAANAALAKASPILRAEFLGELAGQPLDHVPHASRTASDLPETIEPSGTDALAPPALSDTRREAEREAMIKALERTSGNRQAAARLLGVSRSTFYLKMQEYGIE